MSKKKHRLKRPWWTSARTWTSIALTTILVAGLAGGIGLAVWSLIPGDSGGEDSGPPQYLVEPAPDFTLPTTSGDQFSLAEHSGRHNVLLFINEGMG